MTPGAVIPKLILTALLAALIPYAAGSQSLRFSDNLSYNEYYSASVETQDGEVYTLIDMSVFDIQAAGQPAASESMYFFWVRRLSDSGAVTYPLFFREIASIEFQGPYGVSLPAPDRGQEENPVPAFTKGALTLIDGTRQTVHIKTDGFLGGIDENDDGYVLLWLAHDSISRIDFLHNGSPTQCSQCQAIYYDHRLGQCRFDNTPLIPVEEP